MKKRFNVAGPCIAERHYMLPAAERLPRIPDLIEQGAYFAVHAPRQTGKTTTLRAIARQVTAAGDYAALHFSCEQARVFGDDFAGAETRILDELHRQARLHLPADLHPPEKRPDVPPGGLLSHALGEWAQRCPRPLVLFFDEIDALTGRSLISVLSQLRTSFPDRPDAAPWSIALCGMRDVRDYKAASGGDPERLGTASPFNIKTESMRLGNFTRDEIARLYHQHTEATGQPFTEAAIDRAFALTAGQPWLVNAMAREIVDVMAITDPIDPDHIEAARHRLARAHATHLDSLLARLREPRVRRIIEPILAGGSLPANTYDDDRAYVSDLGLIAGEGEARISNPIYEEVIARTLAPPLDTAQLPGPQRFVRAGRLDLPSLLRGFAEWWVQNGEIISDKLDYHEAAPHLVLMAFLQRIVNGGGFIDREFGIGRRRLDLLVRWPLPGGEWQREAIECKVWSDESRRGDPLPAGLAQLDEYLARLGLDHGALVVFDRRAARAGIEARTGVSEARTPAGRVVWVVRG
ncbi:MAG: ATP-binding protein [Myxococcales bacterium]|nr:ATP-binding protein [Myxococcales bacterium]MCB9553906.1 ATP-binding protein [Myxococcales bacterium]